MNYRVLLFIASILFVSCKEGKKQNSKLNLPSEIAITYEWFSAWELVSEDIYNLNEYEPVDFVFFDDKNVYSTSPVTIPDGKEIDGPIIFDQELIWKKEKHNGKLILPTGEIAPVGLMVFASPLQNSGKEAFFVMPLPKFWKDVGIPSDLPYELFLTGIFLHEFSHTQQMNGIGTEISRLAETVKFSDNLSDEIVQEIFSENPVYVEHYKLEHSKIFEALKSNETETSLKLTEEILNLMKVRQDRFFIDDYSALTELNQLFMTMEGVGQYTMYKWLIHPKGGNLNKELAFNGTRTKSWIQDEGFGFALLLSEFENPQEWGTQVFGENSKTLNELMELAIKKL